ncbi:YHS domain-containing (seleno)protein [Pseudocolwellia sp. HL-MZ19]|uniref:YHS domain-containing (seleno)protein n=1 Tax=unclassified Pseudocolwellia TaxID=2848178 RepID=UPI003CEF76A5
MFKTTLKTLLAGSILAASSLSFAADIDMNADANDLAIQGYDPVSYFANANPTIGKANYTATYKGGIYRFSSEENRDTFKNSPSKYAPQYGGYCAFGVSMEKKFDTDPLAWKIVDNKLYLNLNKDVQKKWLTDVPGYLNSANENWPEIKSVEAKKL